MDTGLGSLRINLLLYILQRGLTLMAGDGGIRGTYHYITRRKRLSSIIEATFLSLLKVNINHAAPRVPCHRACR
jgi:hypothetical protein